MAGQQPAGPPVEARSDGQPWMTPYVRRLAHEQGIDPTTIRSAGKRLAAADIDAHLSGRSGGGLGVTCSGDVDVTRLAGSAVGVVPSFVRAIALAVTDSPGSGTDVSVVTHRSEGVVRAVVPDARHLSEEGIRRALTAGARPAAAAGVTVHDLTATPVTAATLPGAGDGAMTFVLGAVRKQPAVLATPDGSFAMTIRSYASLTLTARAGMDLHAAATVYTRIVRTMEAS